MALLFSPAQIARFEALGARGRPETATVAHRTAQRGTAGGTTWQYTPGPTVQVGWMTVSRDRGEGLGGSGGPNAIASGRLRWPPGEPVAAEDRVTIATRLYEVTGVELRGTAWPAFDIVQVTRVS